jgi:hypothetical protein
MHAKTGHSDYRPAKEAFSDRFSVPLRHAKSIPLCHPSANPFSDTYSLIHRDTEFSRLKLRVFNPLFLHGLFNCRVTCDRF